LMHLFMHHGRGHGHHSPPSDVDRTKPGGDHDSFR
jgi:hypothetical protein